MDIKLNSYLLIFIIIKMKKVVILCLVVMLIGLTVAKKHKRRSHQNGGHPINGITGQAPIAGSNLMPSNVDKSLFPSPTPGFDPSAIAGRRFAVLNSHAGACPTSHEYKDLYGSKKSKCKQTCLIDSSCVQLNDRCCYYGRFFWNQNNK
jgi:hypothetical protein